jgi:hypothetical protein
MSLILNNSVQNLKMGRKLLNFRIPTLSLYAVNIPYIELKHSHIKWSWKYTEYLRRMIKFGIWALRKPWAMENIYNDQSILSMRNFTQHFPWSIFLQNILLLIEPRSWTCNNFATLTVDLHSAENAMFCAAATASVLLSAMQSEH